MSSTEKRLLKEYRTVQKELRSQDSSIKSSGIVQLKPSSDNLFKWYSVIQGPTDTPFENTVWKLEIDIPTNYPLEPPAIKFITLHDDQISRLQSKSKYDLNSSNDDEWVTTCYKMPHPNINFKTGEICLDILQKRWSPAWTLQSSLIAIIVLLSNPEPLSPLNIDMANLLKCEDDMAYGATIRYYIGKSSVKETLER
ncbi:hypothetical protein CANARDRAFT_29316 [[Candida] arabinofermentans NRRL YB-2248]|uniref:UBC core domain-containing protein n=1 Tax=[Candida] arabinofermentans NRRL YB-2248 TaxID=983967 RepID=A0A1E4SXD8_9ASCO|nr:hypothetical protein CANARDRAFT_29316 [[Candida] arabinofermentans NRRL YB-2248]